MKPLTAILCFLACTFSTRAQTVVNEKLYAAALKDTVRYQVILPSGRDTAEVLPVIYAFKYGMIDGLYIAAQLRYFQEARYLLPDAIVVVVQADMDHIGLVYKTGQLTSTGKDMLESIEKDIVPAVDRQYHTSGFRVYIGHSYAASYANYLVQYKPALFNGYILMAPEKTGIDYSSLQRDEFSPSPFKLDTRTRETLQRRKIFYYAAVGEYDEPRRHRYARETGKTLEQAGVFYMYDSIPRADHASILSMAIQPAMEFIFRLYRPEIAATDARQSLKHTTEVLKEVYGLAPGYTNGWYNTYAQAAANAKDTASLKDILTAFDSPRLNASDYNLFGMHCVHAGLLPLAEAYYNRAIALLAGDRGESGLLSEVYLSLATDVYKGDAAKGWSYIQKAIPYANRLANVDVYYKAGRFAVDNNYKLKEGIEYLRRFIDKRKQTIDDIHYSLERAYVQMGKAYLLQRNKADAKLYLERALAINAANREAQELLAQVNGG